MADILSKIWNLLGSHYLYLITFTVLLALRNCLPSIDPKTLELKTLALFAGR